MEELIGKTIFLDKLRARFAQLVITAIVLGVGAGITANGISGLISKSSTLLICVGVIILLTAICFTVIYASNGLSGKYTIEGIVFLDKKRTAIEVTRYKLSRNLQQYWKAIAAENKALGKILTDEEFYKLDFDKPQLHATLTPSGKLAAEAIEYFVLDRLSTHLADHFNRAGLQENKLAELDRESLRPIVSQNHFAELFSTPMEEREAFADGSRPPSGRRVVYAIGKDGVVFRDFRLLLPKEAKVERKQHGSIIIKAPRFHMTVRSEVSFCSGSTPSNFERLYMGKAMDDVNTAMCTVTFDIKMGILSLITISGWEYYRWLDSFIETMREEINFERFLVRIGWEQAHTAHILSSTPAASRSRTPMEKREVVALKSGTKSRHPSDATSL